MHIIKDNNEIFHSDIYLGKDYSSGIQHWKYIKKTKMLNGKWHYYYKNDAYESLKIERNHAIGEAIKDRNRLKKSENEARNSTYGNSERRSSKYREDLYRYADSYDRANALIKRTQKAYVKDTPRRAIGNAISFVANLFQKFRHK